MGSDPAPGPPLSASASRTETSLLNEYVSVTGYARKYALRLLNHPEEAQSQYQRTCLYGEEVLNALLAAWTAANHICAKWQAPFLPIFLETLDEKNII